jgi:hypothetical protein
MPLIKSPSKKAFEHNIKAEIGAGKPMKQSLAISYAMKKRSKKMADGGPATSPSPQPVDNDPSSPTNQFIKSFQGAHAEGGPIDPIEDDRLQSKAHQCEMCGAVSSNEEHEGDRHDSMGEPMMAEGGQITDNYQSPSTAMHQTHQGNKDPQETYVKDHQGNFIKQNKAGMSEDDRKLGQHGQVEEGEQGGGQGYHDESYMGNPGNSWDNYSESEDGDGQDMVGRVMKQRQQMFSQGGKVANRDQGVSTKSGDKMAGFMGNEFDDLPLRDDLESTYGDDNNSGDETGDAQEDKDRSDIIMRIMKSRSKKDRNPYPA